MGTDNSAPLLADRRQREQFREGEGIKDSQENVVGERLSNTGARVLSRCTSVIGLYVQPRTHVIVDILRLISGTIAVQYRRTTYLAARRKTVCGGGYLDDIMSGRSAR